MRVGILALQGDVEEHVEATKRAMEKKEISGEIVKIKHSGVLKDCDALIIPGGESTTLSRLMIREGIFEEVKKFAEEGKPIMGVCAGLVLLAKRCENPQKNQKLLELMDITIRRNAFGRQRESFEAVLEIDGKPYNCVFIRAPAVVDVGKNVKVRGRFNDVIVAVEEENLIGLAFHPELTEDTRFHEELIQRART
jgi:5'-phosphate synthase pdxT subunit